VDEHGDYLYRYAYSRLKNTSAAEDTVQEALLAAYQARHRFSGEGSERAWLMGILKHKIVDYIRKGDGGALPISGIQHQVSSISYRFPPTRPTPSITLPSITRSCRMRVMPEETRERLRERIGNAE